MKISRAFALAAATLAIGFFAARWSAAQSAPLASGKEPGNDANVALDQLESFVSYLQDTKQTNTLQRFGDYSNASLAQQHHADLGVTVAILKRLRDGRTNEAYELLEGRVDGDIVAFVASYRELPTPFREKMSLKVLGDARDYRTKFPFKSRYESLDNGVAEAFKVLDQATTK